MRCAGSCPGLENRLPRCRDSLQRAILGSLLFASLKITSPRPPKPVLGCFWVHFLDLFSGVQTHLWCSKSEAPLPTTFFLSSALKSPFLLDCAELDHLCTLHVPMLLTFSNYRFLQCFCEVPQVRLVFHSPQTAFCDLRPDDVLAVPRRVVPLPSEPLSACFFHSL